MKKTILAVLVVALAALVAPIAMGGNFYYADTGVKASPHDLSPTGSNGAFYSSGDSQNRICIYCHAPHNTYRLSVTNGGAATAGGGGPQADDAFDYLPLWNHKLQTNYAYSMYYAGPGAPSDPANPKAQQSLTASAPGSTSLLCLSCHDGSVAVNAYGNPNQPTASQSAGSRAIDGKYIIGKGLYLGNHHPIGFDYDVVAGVDSGLNPSTAAFGPAGSTTKIVDHLYSNVASGSTKSMECGTCHSVHNKGNDTAGQLLLWQTEQASSLCLACHRK